MDCKLTDKDGQTHGGCQWGENITHDATGKSEGLCSDGWIHYYTDPLVAVFMNPAHASFELQTMRLWEFLAEGEVLTEWDKSGCKKGTTIREIPLPILSLEQRVEVAIRLSLLVY